MGAENLSQRADKQAGPRALCCGALGVALCVSFVSGCKLREERNRKIVAHSVSRRGTNEYVLRLDMGEGRLEHAFPWGFRSMKFVSRDGRPITTNRGGIWEADGRIVGEVKFNADISDFPVEVKGLVAVNVVELPWEYVLTAPADDSE